MSNVMDMLVKSGYEAISIGNDVLPCTLRKDDELIGFLMEDFSVKLLPEHEQKRDSLQKQIKFSLDNQELETIENEYKLSQYQDVVLTADYDFEQEKPIYNIYYLDNGEYILRSSSYDKQEATRDFASRSGLVPSEIPTPERNTERIEQFIKAVKDRGFKLLENKKEPFRAYDITDSDGNLVGFIDKDNRVNLTTDNERTKRIITETYRNTNPNRVILPSFFEKLKEKLKQIGMALKVVFNGGGRHYTIQNEHHQEIAAVNENEEITYTSQAKKEEIEKINRMVDEIKRENLNRNKKVNKQETVKQHKTEISKEQPILTHAEIMNLTNTVLASPQLTEKLLNVILSDKNLAVQLNENLTKKISEHQKTEKLKDSREKVQQNPVKENSEHSKIREDFNKKCDLLKTLDGFNQEKYSAVKDVIIDRFGTIDSKEFESNLLSGKYDTPKTLDEKLKASQKMADRQNAGNGQREQQKEKERA